MISFDWRLICVAFFADGFLMAYIDMCCGGDVYVYFNNKW